MEGVGESKWTALFQLCGLCLAMFIGAFGAGALPMTAQMNQKQLGLFNSLGTGLMLGTALAVIIPEGLATLYTSESEIHEHDHAHQELLTNETIVGAALVLGFLFMMFVDRFTNSYENGHGHSHGMKKDTSNLSDLGLESGYDADDTDNSDSCQDESQRLTNSNFEENTGKSPSTHSRRISVTIGLLVHAAADGLALGAAKAASGASLSQMDLVVFFAIMMHKVPASFALSMYLRNGGLEKASIHKNLLMFALAAPVGSLTIFVLLHEGFLGLGTASKGLIAFVLLCSGGTFLYVALVHAFQELPKEKTGTLSMHSLCAFSCGCILPVFLAAGHKH